MSFYWCMSAVSIASLMSSSGRPTEKSWAPSTLSLSPTYGRTNSLTRSSRFDAWRATAKIFITEPSVAERHKFGGLSDFKLPRAILKVCQSHHWTSLIPWFDWIEIHCLQLADAKRKNTYRLQDRFYEGLSGWAGSHQGKMVDGDVHDIASLAQALYVSFFCLH
jgi:hypothetical protein